MPSNSAHVATALVDSQSPWMGRYPQPSECAKAINVVEDWEYDASRLPKNQAAQSVPSSNN
jgi:hypothetical protein